MRTATIYNFLIEANIIAGIAILLMIPVRKFFRKSLGNRAVCFAWLLVAVRLLCPLALPNPLINEIATPYNDQPFAIRPIAGQLRVRFRDALEDAWLDSYESISMEDPEKDFNEVIEMPVMRGIHTLRDGMYDGRLPKALMTIYLSGVGTTALWFVLSNVLFRRRLKKARIGALDGEQLEAYRAWCREHKAAPLPVYFTDPLSSACLAGVIRPFIALPLAASPQQARQMLSHEMYHYKAKDHVWALLTMVCCAVHWFNPVVWAAAAMCRMDRELKCDDNVTRDMDEDARKLYAGALIQSVTRRAVPGLPMLATGMSMTGRKLKTRVGGILWGGKRVKGLALLFGVTASLLLVCAFATAEYRNSGAGQGQEAQIEYNGGIVFEDQTLEEALQSENAVASEEEAIRIVKDVFRGDLWKINPDDPDWVWQVQRVGCGAFGKQYYSVAALKKGIGTVMASAEVAVDGSGIDSITNAADPYYTENYTLDHDYEIKEDMTKEEMEELKALLIRIADGLMPGQSEVFQRIELPPAALTVDGCVYYQVEAPYTGFEDSGKTFLLEMVPEIRLIDCYSGNG